MSDLQAVMWTMGFILVGLLIAAAAKRWFGMNSASITVSLLAVPLVVFLVLSGRLSQFEGYGLKTVFREVAEQSVAGNLGGQTILNPRQSALDAIEQFENEIKISAARQSSMDAIARHEGPAQKLGLASGSVFIRSDQAMTLAERAMTALVIKNSIIAGRLRVVAIVDGRGRVIGFFESSWFLDLIPLQLEFTHYPEAGTHDTDALRRQITQTRFWDIVEAPELRAEVWGSQAFIAETATFADTFRTLRQAATNVVVMTNSRGQYRGFVTLDAVVNPLLQALLTDSSSVHLPRTASATP